MVNNDEREMRIDNESTTSAALECYHAITTSLRKIERVLAETISGQPLTTSDLRQELVTRVDHIDQELFSTLIATGSLDSARVDVSPKSFIEWKLLEKFSDTQNQHILVTPGYRHNQALNSVLYVPSTLPGLYLMRTKASENAGISYHLVGKNNLPQSPRK